jgi:hypothetical protein
MKPRHEQPQVRQITLLLRRHTQSDVERDVAEHIRQLPSVFRVKPRVTEHQIDVWYRFPSDDLLPEIRQILRNCRCDIAAGRLG